MSDTASVDPADATPIPTPSTLDLQCVTGAGCRGQVWLFLNSASPDERLRRFAVRYECLSVGLVAILLAIDVVTSVKSIHDLVQGVAAIEYFTSVAYVIFTAEYLLRLWSCRDAVVYYRFGPIGARLRWTLVGLPLVDLIVLLAFYIQLVVKCFTAGSAGRSLRGLQVLRMFRVFRVAKMLKVDRRTNAIGVLATVLAKATTPILATLTMAAILIVIFATLMYYCENPTNPDMFPSIPEAMWWSVTALTSVGYGDAYPTTRTGKVVGIMAIIVGAGIIALPTGILSMGFQEECQKSSNHLEAEILEENVEMEIHAVDVMSQEVPFLQEALTEVDTSQQQLFMLLRQLFPERVAAVCGDVDITRLAQDSPTSPKKKVVHFDEGPAPTQAATFEEIRADVERRVHSLTTATRHKSRYVGRGITLRSGTTSF